MAKLQKKIFKKMKENQGLIRDKKGRMCIVILNKSKGYFWKVILLKNTSASAFFTSQVFLAFKKSGKLIFFN